MEKKQHIADNIKIGDGCRDRFPSNYDEVIGVLEQKGSDVWQNIFQADEYDWVSFGPDLKTSEILVRLSTPLSKPTSDLFRHLAKIDTSTGTVSFIDPDRYTKDQAEWMVGIKAAYIGISTIGAAYFNLH